MAQDNDLDYIERGISFAPRKNLKNINTSLTLAKDKKDTSRHYHLLLLKAKAYSALGAFDSVPKCIWLVNRLTKGRWEPPQIDEQCGIIAHAYDQLFITDSALFYFEKALEKSKEEPKRKLEYLDRLSVIHSAIGSNPKAVQYCIEGIKTADKDGLMEYSAIFNNRMGSIYESLDDNNQALSFFNKALLKYEDLNDLVGQANSKVHIGSSHLKVGNYEDAEDNFSSALDIFISVDEKEGVGNAYEQLGQLQYAQGNVIDAIDFQKRSLALRYGNKLYRDLPRSYVALANYYLSLKRYDDALETTRDGLSVTQKTGAEIQLLDLYNQFYLIFKDLNYKDSALLYHERYTSLKDEIDQVKNDQLVIRLRNTFETERRELELSEVKRINELLDDRLKTSEKINRQDRLLRILLSVIILVLLIVAVLFYSRYRVKSIANKLISRKVKENVLLLQELHHRVKNNLQFISSLLNLQMFKMKDETSKNLVHESVQKVKAMSLVNNQLKFNINTEVKYNFNSFIKKLTSSLVLSLGLDNDQLVLIDRWRKTRFDMDSYNAIGLVINEMITNSFKHCDADSLEIKIAFVENEKFKMIRYEDNGPGLDENFFTEEKQMGITLMKLLVEDLGGVLRYVKPKTGQHGIRIHINLRKNSKNGR